MTHLLNRTPTETRSPRMGALARLPVFLALSGRRAIVAGGTPAATWKAELLSAAGAAVEVYAPDASDELLTLAGQTSPGSIVVHRRDWTGTDFDGAAIAVGACEDDAQAQRFAEAARAAGVPVNVIDKPKFCDFAFGAIVNRSPLVIGISTDGAAPVFSQAIRAKLEALIPRGFTRWAEAARRWRRDVQSSELSFNGRRRFWQLFTERAVTDPGREPQQYDYDRLLAEARAEGARVEQGTVTLVGAGPGDPELLTLRAVRALQSADVILFDDLVSPEVLEFSRREAKKMLVGKTGHGPSCTQDDINTLMVGLAKSGKRVVRLKGGDPMIFGRAGEEIAACRAAKIPLEVVPGITAAQGAASRLAVSLSHRNLARRIQYITGHSEKGVLPDDIDWKSLADPHATTAVYMPARTLSDLVAHGVAAGLDRATPAIAIINATRPSEVVIAAPIADLPQRLAAQAIDGPVLVMIGHVLAENAMTASAASQGGKDGTKDGSKRTKRK
jgi:uroporphyrin-III C-methyltransferase/precorrin-2 dehydrogenase/sirohydrochlorin ferrochelatase